jgi:hypothetical protein
VSPEISASLNSFRFPNQNSAVVFRAVHGTVVADKIWSETHVSSFGGGGYLNQGTGLIHAPTIASFSSTSREIWIRTASGMETNIRAGEGVKVNTGNDVSVLYSGQHEKETAIALVNRTTRRWHIVQGSFKSVFLRDYCRVPKSKRSGFFSIFVYVVILVLVMTIVAMNTRVEGRFVFSMLYKFALQLSFPLSFRAVSIIRKLDDIRLIFAFKAVVLALVAFSLFRKYQSWMETRTARKQDELGSRAFEEHCERICQSMF